MWNEKLTLIQKIQIQLIIWVIGKRPVIMNTKLINTKIKVFGGHPIISDNMHWRVTHDKDIQRNGTIIIPASTNTNRKKR